jgi:hypothetical protein
MLALGATLLSALVLVSSAPALTGSCGQVVPPIPAGRHEEFTFFKVDPAVREPFIAALASADVELRH